MKSSMFRTFKALLILALIICPLLTSCVCVRFDFEDNEIEVDIRAETDLDLDLEDLTLSE